MPEILSYILKKIEGPSPDTVAQEVSSMNINNNTPVLVTPSKLRGLPPKTVLTATPDLTIQFKDLQTNKWMNFGKERKDAKVRIYCLPYNGIVRTTG